MNSGQNSPAHSLYSYVGFHGPGLSLPRIAPDRIRTGILSQAGSPGRLTRRFRATTANNAPSSTSTELLPHGFSRFTDSPGDQIQCSFEPSARAQGPRAWRSSPVCRGDGGPPSGLCAKFTRRALWTSLPWRRPQRSHTVNSLRSRERRHIVHPSLRRTWRSLWRCSSEGRGLDFLVPELPCWESWPRACLDGAGPSRVMSRPRSPHSRCSSHGASPGHRAATVFRAHKVVALGLACVGRVRSLHRAPVAAHGIYDITDVTAPWAQGDNQIVTMTQSEHDDRTRCAQSTPPLAIPRLLLERRRLLST